MLCEGTKAHTQTGILLNEAEFGLEVWGKGSSYGSSYCSCITSVKKILALIRGCIPFSSNLIKPKDP